MAKKSSIENNNRRARMAKAKLATRTALKAIAMDRDLPFEDRMKATMRLAQMPRNSAQIRVRNRCEVSGRARGFYRKFKVSRIALRELGSQGMIPGITKASW